MPLGDEWRPVGEWMADGRGERTPPGVSGCRGRWKPDSDGSRLHGSNPSWARLTGEIPASGHNLKP